MSSNDVDVVEVVPVDPKPVPKTIYATALAVRDSQKRPVIPAWARNREEARQLARWLAKFGLHVSLYHLTRLPKYAGKLVARAPFGILVALLATAGWVFDREATPLRADAVRRGSVDEYMTLSRQRNARVKQRAIVAGGGVLVAVVATVAATWASGWAQWAYVAVAVVVLGKLGTPSDRRITDIATVNASAPPRLTADVVTRALQSLGIAAMTGKGVSISYVAPITRDGPGWRADVDLPYGVTVTDIVERRDRLASGLRRPLGCVWPDASGEEHAGRLVLWVGDQDLAKSKPSVWPLAKGGTADLHRPFPFGVDKRGRLVELLLMFESVLIGSKPRMGKTFAMRVLILAAALDPLAQLRVFELKGTGDLSMIETCCHAYGSGADETTLEACMATLREVYSELDSRAATIRKLPREVCPENKVTPQLSAQRGLKLHTMVIGIDECQELFSNKDLKDEAARLTEAIIKRGPALGIILILATQRPDANSLPTGVSANIGIRFCLRVMGQTENDMVLGTSSYKNGLRATMFTAKDKGIGYLVGAGDEALIVRTAYIDAPAAEVIALRARAAREAAGTLSGHALGESAPLTPAASLLEDLRVVFATITVERVWNESLVDELAKLRPEVYGSLTPEALTALLKPFGISTGHQVWGRLEDGTGANRRGLLRAEVLDAIGRPEIKS